MCVDSSVCLCGWYWWQVGTGYHITVSISRAQGDHGYCHVTDWILTGFGLVIGFIGHLQNVTTNNYDSLTELHTPEVTVTTAHIKVFSVFTSLCLVAASNTDVLLAVFPNYPRPQLPDRNSQPLSWVLCYDRRSVGIKHPFGAHDQIFNLGSQLSTELLVLVI
jgi:hypothetical protein